MSFYSDFFIQIAGSGYYGTAEDSFTYFQHENMRFTTRDQDNDEDDNNNCAQAFTGVSAGSIV